MVRKTPRGVRNPKSPVRETSGSSTRSAGASRLAQGRHRLRPGFRVARPLRGRCHAGAVRRALVQEYHNICGGREIVLRVIQIPARRALITQGRCDCSSRNRSMAGASSSAVNGIAMSSAMSCCPVHAAASANPTRWPVTSRCSLSCSITTSRRTWSTVVNRSANSWAKSTTRSTRCRSACSPSGKNNSTAFNWRPSMLLSPSPGRNWPSVAADREYFSPITVAAPRSRSTSCTPTHTASRFGVPPPSVN